MRIANHFAVLADDGGLRAIAREGDPGRLLAGDSGRFQGGASARFALPALEKAMAGGRVDGRFYAAVGGSAEFDHRVGKESPHAWAVARGDQAYQRRPASVPVAAGTRAAAGLQSVPARDPGPLAGNLSPRTSALPRASV